MVAAAARDTGRIIRAEWNALLCLQISEELDASHHFRWRLAINFRLSIDQVLAADNDPQLGHNLAGSRLYDLMRGGIDVTLVSIVP